MSKTDGVLRESRLLKMKAGVNVIPEVVVNGIPFHGELDAIDVF